MIESKAVNFLNSSLGKNLPCVPNLKSSELIKEKDYEFFYFSDGSKHSFLILSLSNFKIFEYHSNAKNKSNDKVIEILDYFKDKREAVEDITHKNIQKKLEVSSDDLIGVHSSLKDKYSGIYSIKNKSKVPLGSWYLIGDVDMYDINQYAYFCEGYDKALKIYKKTRTPVFCFFNKEDSFASASNIQEHFGTMKFVIVGVDNIKAKRVFVNCIVRDEKDLSFVREDFTEIAPLGCLDNEFHYYTSYSNTVFFTQHKHSRDFMLSLAPYRFYKEKFKKKEKEEADMDKASSFFKELCLKKGSYDPEYIRESGAFKNHNGDIYIWNGNRSYGLKHESYIHTHSKTFKLNVSKPRRVTAVLKKFEHLVDITAKFSWMNKKTSAEHLISWLCIAPFCGALPWRPHIYMTGRSSSGKSWTQDNLVSVFLKDKCLELQGNTTEAAVRKAVCNNQIPCLFDEFERSEDRYRNAEFQKILDFLKLSSTGGYKKVMKSSSNHKLHIFAGKTIACLSSIFLFLKKPEDINRFLIFQFSERNMNLGTFKPIERQIKEFPIEEFSSEVISYVFNNFKRYEEIFNKEAVSFSIDIEKIMGKSNNHFSRSLATLSALTRLIGYEMEDNFRSRWIKDQLSLRNVSNPQKDCLNFLLSSIIEFERSKKTFKSHITDLYFADDTYKNLKGEPQKAKLRYKDDLGIFFKGKDLYISRGHRVLNDLFKGNTEFSDFAWYESLSNYVSTDDENNFRIRKSTKNIRFGSTVSYALIFENYGSILDEESLSV